MVDKGSYVCIQSFMVNDLKLKGNELIVYAVIYGYTQDGEHWYYGTRGHLAEWCGATKDTVSNCLKSLVRKGYITKRESEAFGYRRVQYQAAALKKHEGCMKNYHTPTVKNQPFNNKVLQENNNTGGSDEEVGEYIERLGF